MSMFALTPKSGPSPVCACGGTRSKCKTGRLDLRHERREPRTVRIDEISAPTRSAGERPLELATRSGFEDRFGRDSSAVPRLGPDPRTLVVGLTTAAGRVRSDLSQISIHPLASGAIQTKLTINKSGDEYEQEADRVADRVMRMLEPVAVATPAASSAVPGVQRKCSCGGNCDNCKAGQEQKHLQMKSAGSSDLERTTVPPIVHDVLRQPGTPLNARARALFEPRFGRDFSHVRVHTGADAAASAKAVNALAYTVGSHVVFAREQTPDQNPRLLAHELVHVEQQRGAAAIIPATFTKANHAQENVADRVADQVMMSSPNIETTPRAGSLLSRWIDCNSAPFTGMQLGPACPQRVPGEIARSRGGLIVGAIDSPENGEIAFGFAVGSGNASSLAANPVWRAFGSNIAGSTDHWEILGFTDCEGPESLNTALRQERAVKVLAQLPAAARSRIDHVAGAAMGDCVAQNDSESNRKFNRSVVFRRTSETVGLTAEAADVITPGPIGCFDGKTVTVVKNGKRKSCPAFTSSDAPTPSGTFCVRQQGVEQREDKFWRKSHSNWFLLEPQFETTRDRMDLHPGSRSKGCITVTEEECFKGLADLLNSGGATKGFGYDGYPPGNEDNVKNPRKEVDCVAMIEVTSREGACSK